MIRLSIDPLKSQPGRHTFSVTDGQCIDDPAAGHARKVFREPSHAGSWTWEPYVLKYKALANQGTSYDLEISQLSGDVLHHPVVRGSSGCEDRQILRQRQQDTHNSAIIGTKVVAPFRDAMRFVDYKQTNTTRDMLEHLRTEILVG